MNCPRCEKPLDPKVYEGVTIDRCGKCHGVWLDDGEIAAIVDIREEKFDPRVVREVIQQAFAGIPTAVAAASPPARCPKCAKAMRLLNYGYDSGIVIDRCPGSEGVWLDSGEIEKIQAHQEEWAKEAPKYRDEWIKLLRQAPDAKSASAAELAKRAEHGTFMFRKFLSLLVK